MATILRRPRGLMKSLRLKQAHNDIPQTPRQSSSDKIPIFGLDGSGKSTMMNQFKILIQGGFTDEELELYRYAVINQLVSTAWYVGRRCLNHEGLAQYLPYHEEDLKMDGGLLRVGQLEELGVCSVVASVPVLNEDLARHIVELSRDPNVEFGLRQGSYPINYNIIDSARYFLENATRICAPGYVPTELDVVHVTGVMPVHTGLTEISTGDDLGTCICNPGNDLLHWRYRHRFKKWIHYFEGVRMIIFCVDLTSYDKVIGRMNTLRGAMDLYSALVNSDALWHAQITLCLTKFDIFKRMLKDTPFQNFWYRPGDQTRIEDPDLAAAAIARLFVVEDRSRRIPRVYKMNLVDTAEVQEALSSVASLPDAAQQVIL